MELSVRRDQDLVVAIDVGSTYSGYAWQWRSHFLNNRSNVEFHTNWGQSAQLQKTNTALLIKVTYDRSVEPPKEIVTLVRFGYEAERKYSNICSNQEQSGEKDSYFLFKKFKLLLYRFKRDEDFPNEPEVEDSQGRMWPLKDVLSMFIHALRDHFLTHHGRNVDQNKILWVLTVPALWSEKAKKYMRDAAEQDQREVVKKHLIAVEDKSEEVTKGIEKKPEDKDEKGNMGIPKKQLLLASEPEAAAIYCINLPKEQQAIMNDIGTPGHIFLSVDLGGGTADLTAVQVQEDGYLKEMCNEQGVLVGGQNVNEAFFQSCNDSFEGQEWIQTLTKATPLEMMKLEHDFEAEKVKIGSGTPADEFITLSIPKGIRRGIEKGNIKLKQAPGHGLVIDDDELKCKSAYIRDDLFKQSCELVFVTIEKVLNKGVAIQTVVLVGGFAESKILQDNIREKLKNKYKETNEDVQLVVPTSPSRAVLHGAVLYGHDMFIFKSRISRATYGVCTNPLFDEQVHDVQKKWLNEEDGKYYCKDIFDVHVSRGQSVMLNEKQPTKIYNPMYKSLTQINLPLYERMGVDQRAGSVIYVTDEHCEQVGDIVVDMPDTTMGTDRDVEVAMIYGGTQLSVIATDKTSGKEYRAEINFDR